MWQLTVLIECPPTNRQRSVVDDDFLNCAKGAFERQRDTEIGRISANVRTLQGGEIRFSSSDHRLIGRRILAHPIPREFDWHVSRGRYNV